MKPETADCLTKRENAWTEPSKMRGCRCPISPRGKRTLPLFTPPKRIFSSRPVGTVKTHRGLRPTFSRIARNEPRIAPEYLTFLSRAYELKSIAGLQRRPGVRPITADDPARTIETAERFIDTITQLLPPGPAAPRSSAAQP
jgi:hypothetical protein